ncbi:MAG TPA: amino acid ABC transporter ATP-binding protein [Microbacteriaceae bacterium]|nr:amino acid ABC transporter ATP-binding protein [Microbacteriaceae bacterium]
MTADATAISVAQTVARSGELIRVAGLTKSFGDIEVLKHVDLSVAEGEVVSILGRSGGGKSTLLRCLNLLETPSGGTIEVSGRRVFADGIIASQRNVLELRKDLGMVFQSFHLFPHLTAVENVALGLLEVRRKPREEALEIAVELLDKVGLVEKATSLPGALSGGQQQRVAIARALALRPKALLFDEPTSALDPESTIDVLRVMRELSAEGMTMLVVTHELAFAEHVGNRMVLMDGGEIIEDDAPAAVRESSNPRTRSFFQSYSE